MDSYLPIYKALITDVENEISILANTSAFIMQEFTDISWSGFYLTKDEELILGPFQGKVACTNIKIGSGVCGSAAAQKVTFLVPNVHEFPGHIACDAASNSELVVPLVLPTGEVYGVLDLDSTSFNRFTEKEQEFFEALCKILITALVNKR